jgi:dihydrofolate reductase
MTGWFRPGQVPVVLTARKGDPVPGGWAVASVPEAVDLASRHGAGELLVCGGGQVYAATLPFADEVILTTVEIDIDSLEATWFPELPPAQWTLLETLTFQENPDNTLPMTIRRFVRSQPAAPAAELT